MSFKNFPQQLKIQHFRTLLIFGAVVLLSSIVITVVLFHRFPQYFSSQRGLVAGTDTIITDEKAIQVFSTISEETVVKTTSKNALDDDILAVLLLGYGGAGHDGGYLSDVIQVVIIQPKLKKTTLVSIPRDVWVALPDGTAAKINRAFTLGDDKENKLESGGEIAEEMIGVVLGIPIDFFVGVDFVGFKRLIGQELKGITVQVTETLADDWYPIAGEEANPCGKTPEEIAALSATYNGFELEKQFPCRYKQVYFAPGNVVMQGGDALEFVRSRHGSSGGDFSRSQRQHQVLAGIRETLFSLDAVANAADIYQLLVKHVTTNLAKEDVLSLAQVILDPSSFTTNSLVLSTSNVFSNSTSQSGQYILIPKLGLNDFSEIHTLVEQELKR